MYHVGLDIHWRSSTVCILDQNGKRVKRHKIRGGWRKVLEWLRGVKQPFEVCFEASCGYGYLYEELSKLARRVVVAHPGQLRLIFRCKRKHDRVDAEKLAKLLYLGEVPPVHVPSREVRIWRGMIEYRRRVIDKRTRCKNGIRSLLRSHGLSAPRGLWTRKGRSWLETVELPTPMAGCQLEMFLEELDHFNKQVKRVTSLLDSFGRRHSGVLVVETIPGVGPRTAEAIVAYIDNPHRFRRNRQVGAYFGLVPCEDSSAGAQRLGHITKQGPATARRLLVEAAWQAIRRDERVRAYFERMTQGKPDRRKIAVVATAHYLLRCMLAMLQTGEAWREAA